MLLTTSNLKKSRSSHRTMVVKRFVVFLYISF